jgi:hypothetical protein
LYTYEPVLSHLLAQPFVAIAYLHEIVRIQAALRSIHQQKLAHGRPGAARGLCKHQDHVLAFIEQGAFDQVDREMPIFRQRDHRSLKLLGMSRRVNVGLGESVGIVAALHIARRIGIFR